MSIKVLYLKSIRNDDLTHISIKWMKLKKFYCYSCLIFFFFFFLADDSIKYSKKLFVFINHFERFFFLYSQHMMQMKLNQKTSDQIARKMTFSHSYRIVYLFFLSPTCLQPKTFCWKMLFAQRASISGFIKISENNVFYIFLLFLFVYSEILLKIQDSM